MITSYGLIRIMVGKPCEKIVLFYSSEPRLDFTVRIRLANHFQTP